MSYSSTTLLTDLPFVASSLVGIGSEMLTRGDEDGALTLFDSAYRMLSAPTQSSLSVAAKQIQMGSQHLLSDNESVCSFHEEPCLTPSCVVPDLYQEDESDVGPRILQTPVRLDPVAPTESDVTFIEAVTLFNKALVHHVKAHIFGAKQLYEVVVYTVHNLLNMRMKIPSTRLLELAMRVHNNLGLVAFAEGNDDDARAHFEAGLLFSNQLADLSKAYRLEHANILSNWCRINWMRGDISDNLHKALREILRIRSSVHSWDHPDVAAAHYNLATAEYARRRSQKAIAHLMQFLHVAAHRSKNDLHDLDPIPALIYLLLVQHEDKDDSVSQELVRGLRTLQDKRQDQGQNGSEVASVLNFIGTLLFHKEDLDNALLFFQEELRLEEKLVGGDDDISVSVTCNNIGRILQELCKYEEAIYYYQRALEAEYGETIMYKSVNTHACVDTSPSTSNLYSTVWYNLGLIHDKRGSYDEAIAAFKMSLELRKAMLGRDHPDIACLYYNIGVLQMEQDQLKDASVSLKEALRVRCHGGVSQLNDQRVIKTLEKLASLHKSKGNINGAIDALKEVLRIIELSKDFDQMNRLKDMGLLFRSISELHHVIGDCQAALYAALTSVRHLEALGKAYERDFLATSSDKLANIEQLVSSLLMVGSLHHEMCEPLLANAVLYQAANMIHCTAAHSLEPLPSSLVALREVASMLGTAHCAPEA